MRARGTARKRSKGHTFHFEDFGLCRALGQKFTLTGFLLRRNRYGQLDILTDRHTDRQQDRRADRPMDGWTHSQQVTADKHFRCGSENGKQVKIREENRNRPLRMPNNGQAIGKVEGEFAALVCDPERLNYIWTNYEIGSLSAPCDRRACQK